MTVPRPARKQTSPALIVGSLAIDVLLVVLFAGLGRSSHAREATFAGLVDTATPFLVGLAIAWLVSLAWKSPLAVLRTGLPLWIGTVTLGLLLRAVMGQGTAFPFVVVTTLTLCAFLVGWRLILGIVRRVRARR